MGCLLRQPSGPCLQMDNVVKLRQSSSKLMKKVPTSAPSTSNCGEVGMKERERDKRGAAHESAQDSTGTEKGKGEGGRAGRGAAGREVACGDLALETARPVDRVAAPLALPFL